jgi:hypothetical protein
LQIINDDACVPIVRQSSNIKFKRILNSTLLIPYTDADARSNKKSQKECSAKQRRDCPDNFRLFAVSDGIIRRRSTKSQAPEKLQAANTKDRAWAILQPRNPSRPDEFPAVSDWALEFGTSLELGAYFPIGLFH